MSEFQDKIYEALMEGAGKAIKQMVEKKRLLVNEEIECKTSHDLERLANSIYRLCECLEDLHVEISFKQRELMNE